MALGAGIVGQASRRIKAAVMPVSGAPRKPRPALCRTVVGVGPHGCFDGLDRAVQALLPDGGPHRATFLGKLYEKDRRFHLVRRGGWDLAFYAPEGFDFSNHCDVRGHLERAHDAVAGMAGFSLLAEWGTDPSLTTPLDVLASSGGPVPGMPCLALCLAQWERMATAPFDASRRAAAAGPASHAFGGAVAMFAVADTPREAAATLTREVGAFSRSTHPLRPVEAAPGDALVADMGEGWLGTLDGASIRHEPEAVPRP